MTVLGRLFAAFLGLLDLLLVVLFLVGYVARYVHPRYLWWAELVATGLPYVSVLVLVATLVVLLARRWKLLLLHGVLVGLMILRFGVFDERVEPGPQDLTLLTYNTSRGGGARAEDQQRAITDLIRGVEPDLVALQESFVRYHPRRPGVTPDLPLTILIDSLGYRTMRPPNLKRATYTPLPVLGRVQLLEQTQTEIPIDPENPTRVVRTHFIWQGREAVHYNLHLRSFGSRKPWEDGTLNTFSPRAWASYLRQYRDAFLIRAQEVEAIRAILDRETLPLLISGDLNSTPHNWGFYRLSAGMQDAFKVAGKGWGGTYHANMPLVRIDHVLVGPEWEIVSAHVLRARLSDHRPLLVRLRWRE